MMISKLRRIEMNKIDGSDTIIYSAVINGYKVAQMKTDGCYIPHITITEWYNVVKDLEKRGI
jgi:hypothetical protein